MMDILKLTDQEQLRAICCYLREELRQAHEELDEMEELIYEKENDAEAAYRKGWYVAKTRFKCHHDY